jgi:NIMA (never in mitosis gene a)-related kinase
MEYADDGDLNKKIMQRAKNGFEYWSED